MKKFMKAIAFATVMCMLLSVAAFATDAPDFEIAEAGTVEVIVEGVTASTPIAFVVTDTTVTEAADIATANIKDVTQDTTDPNGDVTVTLGTGGLDAVNIFYGYQGVGESATMKTAALQVEVNTTVVVNVAQILHESDIAALENQGKDIAKTDNDMATAIIAKVGFNNLGDKSVSRMIWSIRYGTGGVAYAEANASLFEVLDGDTQIALAFSNGNKNETIAPVTVTGLEAIVLLSDGETIYSETEKFDQLDAQKKPVVSEEN